MIPITVIKSPTSKDDSLNGGIGVMLIGSEKIERRRRMRLRLRRKG